MVKRKGSSTNNKNETPRGKNRRRNAQGYTSSAKLGDTTFRPSQSSDQSPQSTTIDREGLINLSQSQKRVLDVILQKKSVFFSGAAGAGKSFLLKVLQDIMSSIDKGDKIAFTAPTGVAACNIRGMTINSWAGIGFGKDPVERILAEVMRKRDVLSRWRETEILVIDEISMLPDTVFELLSKVGSRVRGNPRPFGGLQLVLCGDFFQLPPVGLGRGIKFCFESVVWNEVFTPRENMIFLQKGFRQKDGTFLQILNELRQGTVSSNTESILRRKVDEFNQKLIEERKKQKILDDENIKFSSTFGNENRKFKTVSSKPAIVPTKLFSKNDQVDEYNACELQKLTTKSYIFACKDEGREPFLGQLRNGLKAPEKLELKVGSQVLLLKNLDTNRGLVNGARGVVVGFEMQLIGGMMQPNNPFNNTNDPLAHPALPIVQFEINRGVDEKIVEKLTLKTERWELINSDRVMASRLQIPLMLAWAISVHKAQGMTIPDLEVSLDRSVFEYGQAYVAISRATSLEGLLLKEFDRNCVKASDKVKDFYRRMGTNNDTSPKDEECVSTTIAELASTLREEDRTTDRCISAEDNSPQNGDCDGWMASKHTSNIITVDDDEGENLKDNDWEDPSLPFSPSASFKTKNSLQISQITQNSKINLTKKPGYLKSNKTSYQSSSTASYAPINTLSTNSSLANLLTDEFYAVPGDSENNSISGICSSEVESSVQAQFDRTEQLWYIESQGLSSALPSNSRDSKSGPTRTGATSSSSSSSNHLPRSGSGCISSTVTKSSLLIRLSSPQCLDSGTTAVCGHGTSSDSRGFQVTEAVVGTPMAGITALTEDQKRRLEENRQAAMRKRDERIMREAQLQHCTSGASPPEL